MQTLKLFGLMTGLTLTEEWIARLEALARPGASR